MSLNITLSLQRRNAYVSMTHTVFQII